MTLLVACLLLLGLAMSLGGGAAFFICSEIPCRRWTLVVAAFIGLGLLSVAGAWSAALDASLEQALVGVLLVATVFWIVAMLKGRVASQDLGRAAARALVLFMVMFVCAAASLGFSKDAWRFRIGPDAIGYVTSAGVLSNGVSRGVLAAALEDETGGTAEEIFDLGEISVQSSPSLRIQVASEFLLGANRWGFPFSLAVVALAGEEYLWSGAAACMGLGLGLTALITWGLVRKRAGTGYAIAAVAGTMFSASLLNSWLEGGLGQVWITPFVSVLVWILVDSPQVSARMSILFAAFAWAVIISSYQDGLVLVLGLTICFALLAMLVHRALCRRAGHLLLGLVLAILILGPFSLTLLDYLGRRLRDAGTGGWWQPHWLSPAEFMGIGVPYPNPQGVLWPQSPLSQSLGLMTSVLVLAWLTAVLVRAGRDPAVVIVLAAGVTGAGVFAASRYLMQTSNYQFSKAAATLAPVLAVGIAVAVARARAATREGMYGSLAKGVVLPGYLLSVAGVVLGGSVFLLQFLGASEPLSARAVEDAYRYRTMLEDHDVVSDGGLPVNALASVVNLRLVSRSEEARIGARGTDHPLGLITVSADCQKRENGPTATRLGEFVFVPLWLGSDPYTTGSRSDAEGWLGSRKARLGPDCE